MWTCRKWVLARPGWGVFVDSAGCMSAGQPQAGAGPVCESQCCAAAGHAVAHPGCPAHTLFLACPLRLLWLCQPARLCGEPIPAEAASLLHTCTSTVDGSTAACQSCLHRAIACMIHLLLCCRVGAGTDSSLFEWPQAIVVVHLQAVASGDKPLASALEPAAPGDAMQE
jgi:hypothetical protein